MVSKKFNISKIFSFIYDNNTNFQYILESHKEFQGVTSGHLSQDREGKTNGGQGHRTSTANRLECSVKYTNR